MVTFGPPRGLLTMRAKLRRELKSGKEKAPPSPGQKGRAECVTEPILSGDWGHGFQLGTFTLLVNQYLCAGAEGKQAVILEIDC